MNDRPRVKICGITSVNDARMAVEAGADYLGLNFFGPSPRCIDVERGMEIRAAVGESVPLVGVFVNHPTDVVAAIDERVGLDFLQFHGDEDPASLTPFLAKAIKVWRVHPGFDVSTVGAFDRCWGFLFDAFNEGLYGGSGRSWDYSHLLDSGFSGIAADKPVFVAGGLRPETIAGVADGLPVHAFDVCSGVESSPGVKDPVLMRRLFEELRHVETATPT